MGAYELIMLAILFIILMFWFYILRFLALPLNIGFPSLSPTPLTGLIWRILIFILNYVFILIIVVAIVLYFVWRMIRMIPLIGWIIDFITPFKELRETGVFGLVEGILGILMSGFSQASFIAMKDRLRDFFRGSQGYARNAVGMRANRLYRRMPPPNERYSSGDYASHPNPAAADMDTRPQTSGGEGGLRAKFTEAELKEIDDQYLKCIMENTDVVTADDSLGARLSKNFKNGNVKTMCKTGMLKSYLDVLSYKGKDAFM